MKNEKKSLGDWGENKAAEFLKLQGYQILCQNYRSPFGEIDIIALKKEIIFFIEVKTRQNQKYGKGFESITLRKLQKIKKTAECYMHTKNLNKEVRVAVISIDLQEKEDKILFLPVDY